MKSMLTQIQNAHYKLLAMSTIMAMGFADSALAQAAGGGGAAGASTVGSAAQGMIQQVENVGKVSIAGAFLGGIYMLAGGLVKLKQASESQGQQTPYSAGMWRLALGGGLVALPALANMMTNSSGLSTVSMTAATF
jgi:hypothetical protein